MYIPLFPWSNHIQSSGSLSFYIKMMRGSRKFVHQRILTFKHGWHLNRAPPTGLTVTHKCMQINKFVCGVDQWWPLSGDQLKIAEHTGQYGF